LGINLFYMNTTSQSVNKKRLVGSEKTVIAGSLNSLHHLAFENSLQANIISSVHSGKLIAANKAACRLLGYSKKEMLTKNKSSVFDINEISFKKMLKQRSAEGHSAARVTVLKKSGKHITCEITSAIFKDEDGIEKAITTIVDMSKSIFWQKKIDIKKDKLVADNIILAKSKQKKIDTSKEKRVAGNIALARSFQKNIDTKNEKIVSENITLAQAKSDARQSEDKAWKKSIGKVSYDVMWDWNIETNEIYVGDSIEEIFGYKVQNNTVTYPGFIRCLLSEEKKIVEKKLMKSLSSGDKNWNDSYLFKRQDSSVASTISRASIVRDETGKAVRLIGAIQDISKLKELEKKQQEQIATKNEQNEVFIQAAKLSYDGIWDWNLLTGEFFLGEGFERLFGYEFRNNTGNMTFDWGKHLHPDDREAVEKGLKDTIDSFASHWEHAYRFVRADGSIANVFGRASIIRDKEGRASRMIGVIHDLTLQNDLEEKLDHEIAAREKQLIEYKENFRLIFNSSSDVFYDVDLVADDVIMSDAYEKEFGYKISGNMTQADVWSSHIHPGDKEAVMQDYLRMIASEDTEWKYSYRFLRADDSIVNIVSNRIILRDASGKAYRMIGSMQDISKQTELEERLEREINLKEKQIAEAMEQAKETERSDIGKELHDNVNQLLSASKLFLELAKKGGGNSDMYLNRSSEYTREAIEDIRKLTRGLTTDTIKNLGLCEAIDRVSRDTMEINPVKITCLLKSFIETSVSDKFKINLFRIVQEQLNNISKHAGAARIIISLLQDKKSISLSIADNGVGFETNKKSKGIGIDNIKSRAASYNGTAEFLSQPGEGCILRVIFPLSDRLRDKV